jgi:hypothetical protein
VTNQAPYIGETYVSKDKRTPDRTIHITGQNQVTGKYTYKVTANRLFPKTIGNKGSVSAHTLDIDYVKISRGGGYGEGGYGNG